MIKQQTLSQRTFYSVQKLMVQCVSTPFKGNHFSRMPISVFRV